MLFLDSFNKLELGECTLISLIVLEVVSSTLKAEHTLSRFDSRRKRFFDLLRPFSCRRLCNTYWCSTSTSLDCVRSCFLRLNSYRLGVVNMRLSRTCSRNGKLHLKSAHKHICIILLVDMNLTCVSAATSSRECPQMMTSSRQTQQQSTCSVVAKLFVVEQRHLSKSQVVAGNRLRKVIQQQLTVIDDHDLLIN